MPGGFPPRDYSPRPRRPRPDRPGRQAGEPGRGERAPRGERPPRVEMTQRPQPGPQPAAGQAGPAAKPSTAWEQPAAWYDQLQGEEGGDFYQKLILPTVCARLQARPGERVLDLCCGQGVLGRALARSGVLSIGVDASAALISAAQARAGALERHLLGDVQQLDTVLAAAGVALPLDHGAVVMGLQDLDPVAPVLALAARCLAAGARLVIAMTHPCFRIARRSSWGFDEEQGVQYRRLDGYLSPLSAPIRIHPGRSDGISTTTFHRPLGSYINACGAAGFGILACDELVSHRRGTRGPRFGAEDRAAREFPIFLVLTAIRLA